MTRSSFRRLFALLFIAAILLPGCKTPGTIAAQMSEYDGSAPLSVEGDVRYSTDEQCDRLGGEIIDGACICADGTPQDDIDGAAHCSAWIKQKYPDCYAKGGMPKAFGGSGEPLCVCPHGESLSGGSGSCYDLFKDKYAECGRKGGIVLADDSICRCLHGEPALKLRGSCEDDFVQQNESCAAKGGVTSEGSACRCRDGSLVDTNEAAKCAERWFFYANQEPVEAQKPSVNDTDGEDTATTDSTDGDDDKPNGGDAEQDEGDSTDSTDSTASKPNCMCQHHQNNCVIYKPGDKAVLKFVKTTAANCTRNFCYKNFSDVIFAPFTQQDSKGGCGGLWDYKAPMVSETASTGNTEQQADIGKYCVCRKLRSNNPVGCAVFLPGKNVPNTYVNSANTCTPTTCVNYFGNSYTLKTHCYDAATKKILWRHQD